MTYRRALMSAAIALALAASALVAGPPRLAVAGGSCTGWTSITMPPDTVRVGRNDGRVEVVPFRRYVGVVMMKEWSPSHPAATLEAGAVAAKQYTWYYAMAGNWRSSYKNAAGECYDVKASTADQLYMPEKVPSVDKRMWRAIDATWGLSVRKSNQFFLTGYRTGVSVPCAQDADGWRLYAKSAIRCGNIGWTREQIQLAYYAPDATFHWAEDNPATETPISAPNVDVLVGTRLGKQNARVEWDDGLARPAGTTYHFQQLVAGDWRDVSLADPEHPALDIVLRPNKAHQYRVRLVDGKGNAGPWYSGEPFVPRLVQSTEAPFAWVKGRWGEHTISRASEGATHYSKRAGAASTFSFTGRALALVGSYGPKRGVARVYIDGKLAAEVDLYAARNSWRSIWFTREFASSGPHTITVEVLGTSGRPRVDLDAALFWP